MKRLAVFDFDGTLINSPDKENGMRLWKEKNGEPYPHRGWWGRPESLDTTLFNIKPFPNVLAQLIKEKNTPDTSVIILTSRMEKLRSEVENVLDLNGIVVDDVILKKGNEGKGDIILKIENYNPDLKEIVVYDDFMDRNAEKIAEYTKIKDQLLPDVNYTLYFVDNGNISLLESSNILLKMIHEELGSVLGELDNYIYHGTSTGAGIHIQKSGGMKINAANNNEPYISFTSNPNVANYYAQMKGGSGRSVILRTKLTNDFSLSPKFDKNKGHEWITKKEIPVADLEIKTNVGWTPLDNWDLIDKRKIN